MSVEEFVIDGGGTDLSVVMAVMTSLTSITITPENLINGAVTDYIISIDTSVELKENDRILITTPPSVTFSAQGASCDPVFPDAIGVTEVTCEMIDNHSLAINLVKINKINGIFTIVVHGLKNPPNFRKSELFSNIYMQTFDYYNIQALENYDDLWIQTNEIGTITEFTQDQST